MEDDIKQLILRELIPTEKECESYSFRSFGRYYDSGKYECGFLSGTDWMRGEIIKRFDELQKFKRKTFGDVRNMEFRHSDLGYYLKSLMNNVGKIIIEIEK